MDESPRSDQTIILLGSYRFSCPRLAEPKHLPVLPSHPTRLLVPSRRPSKHRVKVHAIHRNLNVHGRTLPRFLPLSPSLLVRSGPTRTLRIPGQRML